MKTPWILVRYITNKNHSEIGVINAPTERYRGRGHHLVWITHRQKKMGVIWTHWKVTSDRVRWIELNLSPHCDAFHNSHQKNISAGNLWSYPLIHAKSPLELLEIYRATWRVYVFFWNLYIYIFILWDLIGIMHSFMAYGCLDYAYVWWITSHAMSHIQLQGLSHAIPTLSTPCTCTSSVNHVRSVSETTWQCLSRWPGDHHPSPAWRRYLAGLISYIQCWGIRFCAEILSVLRVVQTLAYTHMLPINMLQCGDPPVMFVGL